MLLFHCVGQFVERVRFASFHDDCNIGKTHVGGSDRFAQFIEVVRDDHVRALFGHGLQHDFTVDDVYGRERFHESGIGNGIDQFFRALFDFRP